MARIRRFFAVLAAISVAAAFTNTSVLGDGGEKSRQRRPIAKDKAVNLEGDSALTEDLAGAKFVSGGVLTYKTKDGALLFALQVKPKLDAPADRPVDYLIMVDTSASQVGVPLATAKKLVEQIVSETRADDRIAIWTVNIPEATRDLARGFHERRSPGVQQALKRLDEEIPLGDTDLQIGLTRAVGSFENDRDRQRVLVFLGDGMSVHSPITQADRLKLCDEMVKNEIAFFPIPLGPRLDSQNLHGLASGTGGRVVRVMPRDQISDTTKRLRTAVSAPVLYPSAFQIDAPRVSERFPSRLPPLRTDAPTLVVGQMDAGDSLRYTVEGTIAGKEVRVEAASPVASAELDNFFLVGMFEQWKNAKDQPALMQADRALAYAQEINQLARVELLAQAEEALARDKLEAAAKLFAQAKELDPYDVEADGGLKVVEKLKSGQLTKDDLRRQLNQRDGIGIRFEKGKNALGKEEVQTRRERLDRLLAQAEQKPQPNPPPPSGAPAPDAAELLRQQRQRQAIEEQRVTQTIDDALREARRELPRDPAYSRDLLRRTLAAIRDNLEIGDTIRQSLVNRLENGLRNVDIEGARIMRDQAEALRRQSLAQEMVRREDARTAIVERTQARMRVFHNLMDQARFEDAYNQALAIIRDAQQLGLTPPVAVTAAYDMGLIATNLAEVQELRRLREERYLMTMLQVEKSSVPFPDEPPIRYPPAATWRQLTQFRKERYENGGLTDEDPVVMRKIRELRDALTKPVSVEFDSVPLKDAISYLTERYGLPIIVDAEAFRNDVGINDVENQTVKLTKISGVSLGTVLRLLLAQVQGTYIIRREYIEVTTGQRQAAEKTIRVYPVGDLVTPIPNSINQAAVNQAIQNSILGAQIDLARASLGGLAGIGGIGGLAGIGGIGGIGGLGGIGGIGGLAGIGGIGALGGAAGLGIGGGGVGGVGGLAGNIGGVAGLQGGGAVNLGVGGGGVAGFGGFGGQLGQFGNLGGQFGIQGGDQSQILIRLIRQVVGKPSDWALPGIFDRPQVGPATTAGQTVEDDPAATDPNEAGALGYYPPARALVVKNTSRIHTRLGGGLLGPRAVGAPPPDKASKLDKIKQDFFARGGSKDDPLKKLNRAASGERLAKAGDGKGRVKNSSASEPSDLDARKVWQEALAKGVTDPGLIIAVADYLVEHEKFDHAAEFLKANLRQGIVVRPWVYEALAIALKEGKGSAEDIERAQLSSLDLAPQDTHAYLQASHAMADGKRYDRAVAFCRQASVLEPDSPQAYADALLYAELAKDTTAMEWAAGNLLQRDWPVDGKDLHDKAHDKLRALKQVLEVERREVEAGRMAATVQRYRQRDLIVRLSWQGDSDLELEVKEPIGTVCSFMARQTPGGGALMDNIMAERSPDSHVETYAAAQGFSGDYRVTARRLWGRPLGSKATLEIIQHHGTPSETRQRETLVFDRSQDFTFHLANGTRTAVARVSPQSTAPRPPSESSASQGGDRVLNKLRAMADPDSGMSTGMQGGTGSAGTPTMTTVAGVPVGRAGGEQMAFQSAVTSSVTNSIDLMAQATVSADRRYVRLSLAPIFETVGRMQTGPIVTNPLIPGGGQFPGP